MWHGQRTQRNQIWKPETVTQIEMEIETVIEMEIDLDTVADTFPGHE